jgi:predicted Zn-dependent protease
MLIEQIERDFLAAAPAVDFCALRFVEESSELLSVRQNVPEPPKLSIDRGAMVTVIERGGLGYAATSDLSASGLRDALDRARRRCATTSNACRWPTVTRC